MQGDLQRRVEQLEHQMAELMRAHTHSPIQPPAGRSGPLVMFLKTTEATLTNGDKRTGIGKAQLEIISAEDEPVGSGSGITMEGDEFRWLAAQDATGYLPEETVLVAFEDPRSGRMVICISNECLVFEDEE